MWRIVVHLYSATVLLHAMPERFWCPGAQDIRTGNVRSPEIDRLEVRGSETNARFTRRRGSGWEAGGNEEGPEDERRSIQKQPVHASPVPVKPRQNTKALREIKRRNLLFNTHGHSLCLRLYHKHRHISFTDVYFSLYKENFCFKINIHPSFPAHPCEQRNSRPQVLAECRRTSQSDD